MRLLERKPLLFLLIPRYSSQTRAADTNHACVDIKAADQDKPAQIAMSTSIPDSEKLLESKHTLDATTTNTIKISNGASQAEDFDVEQYIQDITDPVDLDCQQSPPTPSQDEAGHSGNPSVAQLARTQINGVKRLKIWPGKKKRLLK